MAGVAVLVAVLLFAVGLPALGFLLVLAVTGVVWALWQVPAATPNPTRDA